MNGGFAGKSVEKAKSEALKFMRGHMAAHSQVEEPIH